MYRLQPKFYPHRSDLIEFTQKLQNILSQAVRTFVPIDTATTDGCRIASVKILLRYSTGA